MRCRDKTAGKRDIHNGSGRAKEEFAGAAKSNLKIITCRHALEVFLKKSFQLASRYSNMGRKFIKSHWLFDVGFHQLNGLNQFRLARTQSQAQRHALTIRAVANPLAQHPFRNPAGKFTAVFLAYQSQHHIHRRRST